MEYCLFVEPQEGFSYDDQLAFAQATEAHGFDGFFRSDHYMRMAPGSPLPGPTDAWTTLAGLARETSRIRLGTLVSSVTYRTPGVFAVQVAQVDAMSGGRIEMGLGTGWFEAEHRAYGIPFPERRFALLEEQLEVITGLWETPVGEKYTFEGAHYALTDSPALPKPAQQRVPIIVGGGGKSRTPAIAARFATEFNIGFASEPVIAEKFAGVRAACERIGRDPRYLKLSVALPTLAGGSETDIERRAAAVGQDLTEFRGDVNIVGGVDEITAKVERLRDLGAQRVYFQLMDMRDLDQVAYLGGEVLPALPR
ncbi:F420-dependent oxidoreductase-like protein [Microbacterium endophyticum]|uniref:F420-dependent oxidoreductase-like protein n=1 Tax=Microbacterium endophyticum TaxID=1526412 RepID=A0A7W4YM94_9MICO|nr:LLM class F420-dependent oxidoreductase [Microbacterium endophyticum]MBB2975968.1 F420-dependent oxidoreductase-like protein [Microbacterium endophyticum]NIK37663.1 F420-dependent oxidoreductase-like protein [Microbacterium endophyticum]